MSRRRARDEEECGPDTGSGGFGGFLRSLLSGIPWSEAAERNDRERFKTPAGGLVRLRNANGRIQVIGEDRDDVLVEASKRARAESQEEAQRLLDAIRIAHQETPESLDIEIEVPRRWNRHGHVNLEVRLPRKLRLLCESVNGKLCVSGLRASVGARSSNGSVTVEDVVGNVDVFTANAKVSISGTTGTLVARSSNGKIEIDEQRGSVDASTSNGLIRASLESLGQEGVKLATSNGRIVLELPEAVDADVDVRVDNGVVRNERELQNATRSTDGRLRGSLGRGGVPIKLRTSNGSISLR